MTRVAVIQQPPMLLDRGATLERAVQLLAQAAREGATLVVYPESFVPGYPSWIWRLAAGRDAARMAALHARLLEQSVDLEGGGLAPLAEAARAHGVSVVCGLAERDTAFSRATLYNTVVVLAPDGRLLNRHRRSAPRKSRRPGHTARSAPAACSSPSR